VQQTAESGCCAAATGESKRTSDKCAEKEGRSDCERLSKCQFISGEDADCSWSTTSTTEEPYEPYAYRLGAKPEAMQYVHHQYGQYQPQYQYVYIWLLAMAALAVYAVYALCKSWASWGAAKEGYIELKDNENENIV